MWEIIDDNGTIYSGNENEMQFKFEEMIAEDSDETWEGDLKLIEVHNIYR